MYELRVTFLEVGWGDSILLEAKDNAGATHFGLVDSNDTAHWPSTQVYLKRHLERHARDLGVKTMSFPHFDAVIASHAHTDHVGGLQAVIRRFGTERIYLSRFESATSPTTANLLRWAKQATRNGLPVATSQRYLAKGDRFMLGPVGVSVLWPPQPLAGSPNAPYDRFDENNNSLVLALKLGKVVLVLTGDCGADNWAKASYGGAWPIALPAKGIKLVQLPHHGARNGLFDVSGNRPLFDQLKALSLADSSVEPVIAVSSHPLPHGHPHKDVAAALDDLSITKPFPSCVPGTRWLRTDQSLHFTVWTDGTRVEARARPPF